jgi:hypothetical protein
MDTELYEMIIVKDIEKYRCFIDKSKNIYEQLEDHGVILCPGTCESYIYIKAERF